MLVDDRSLTDQAARIEALLGEIEAFPDPVLRDRAAEVVQGLLLLYGEGLARILAIIERESPASAAVVDALAADELIAHLLLLHDLHPVPLEERVTRALQEVRPYLESHGGNVELIGVEDGVARVRLQGSCQGCPSSTVTLKLAIEEAVLRAAPDLEGIEAEGADAPPAGFVPVANLLSRETISSPEPRWATLEEVSLGDGEVQLLRLEGRQVLLCRLGDTHYAYRPDCPDCGRSLAGAALDGEALACPACGRRYDARHAGRALDAAELHLQPLPLLARGNAIRVALS